MPDVLFSPRGIALSVMVAVVSVCGCDDGPVTPSPVVVRDAPDTVRRKTNNQGDSAETGSPPVADPPAPEPQPPAADPRPANPPAPVTPPTRPFTIEENRGRVRAVIASETPLDDRLMTALGEADGLHIIDVSRTRSPLLRAVPVIRRFPQMTIVFATGEWIPGRVALNEKATAADVRTVSSMREVRRLDLSNCLLGDADLAELDGLVGLESLRLPASITDSALQFLFRMRSLKQLSLEHTRVTAMVLAELPRGLESLNLAGTSIGDTGVEKLSRLTGLKRLWLDETAVSDKALVSLARHDELVQLGLAETAVTSEGLGPLGSLDRLAALQLAGTEIDDKAITILIGMSQLRSLDVTATRLSLAGRKMLAGGLRDCRVQVDVDALVQALKDAGGRMDQALTAVARVTRDKNQRVVALNFFDRGFSDTGMALLSRFTSLKRLSVEGTAVTDAGLQHLAAMTQLEELWLTDTAVTNAGLTYVRSLGSLRLLRLDGTGVTVPGVLGVGPALSKTEISFPGGRRAPGSLVLDRNAGSLESIPLRSIQGLRYLELDGLRCGDDGLKALVELVGIRVLRLRHAGIHGPGLLSLHNMQSLQVLDLTGNPLDEVSTSTIAAWTELREVVLEQTNLTDLSPFTTSGRTALRRLRLAETLIDDRQLILLTALPGLELLDLSGCRVTDMGIGTFLPRLSSLQALGLRGTAVTSAGVQKLTSLTSLRVLWLADTEVAADGLRALGELPELVRLDLSGCRLDDTSLDAVGRLEKLSGLDLRRTSLSPAAVARWGKAHPRCRVEFEVDPLLAVLATGSGTKPVTLSAAIERIGGTVEDDGRGLEVTMTETQLTDAGLARVAGLPGLSRLILAGTPVTGAGLRALQPVSALRVLDLSGTAITDRASDHLSRLSGLVELSLADTGLTDHGLARLVGLKRLETLDLAGLPVTATGLTAALSGIRSLRHLNLSETLVRSADLRILARLPKLESLSIRDTLISDRGIAAIGKLKSLKRLWIDRCRITDKGTAALKTALPGCTVFGP